LASQQRRWPWIAGDSLAILVAGGAPALRPFEPASAGKRLSQSLQVLPHFHPLPSVHRQQLDSGAADGRQTNNPSSFPGKVISPAVHARVEQRDKLSCFGIESGDVWSLVKIAVATCQGEIVRITLPAMLTCNNMFDVEANDS
jgi:hypothetical protein